MEIDPDFQPNSSRGVIFTSYALITTEYGSGTDSHSKSGDSSDCDSVMQIQTMSSDIINFQADQLPDALSAIAFSEEMPRAISQEEIEKDLEKTERHKFLQTSNDVDSEIEKPLKDYETLETTIWWKNLPKGFILGETRPKSKNSYKVEKVLGEGRFGMVYRCKASKDDKNVAVKVMEMGSVSLQEEIVSNKKLWKGEALLKDRFNLISIDKKETPLRCLVFEEYDKTLSEEYPCSPSIDTTIEILHQLLKWLKVLEDNGIIHRDIKPDNIMMKDNEWVLIDFGGSINEETMINERFQTYGAIAMEVLMGCYLNVTSAIDMWSVAASVVNIFLEEEIFEGDTFEETLLNIIAILGKEPPSHMVKNSKIRDEYEEIVRLFLFPREYYPQ